MNVLGGRRGVGKQHTQTSFVTINGRSRDRVWDSSLQSGISPVWRR